MFADGLGCFHSPSWFQGCHSELHVALACLHGANMGCTGALVSCMAFDGLFGTAMVLLSFVGFEVG